MTLIESKPTGTDIQARCGVKGRRMVQREGEQELEMDENVNEQFTVRAAVR